MRFILALLMIGFLALPVGAQEVEAEWQAVVTGQIEAMRAGDGEEALTFAGAAFREQFSGQPELFLGVIGASGYAPILTSRSHSFGRFERIDDDNVLQGVNFVGEERELYEAAYQLRREEGEGWRVQGVLLRKQAGLAI